MTVDGQPPSQPFPGAVAVLHPSGQPAGDQVQLEIDSASTGGPQALIYFVQVCGPRPYRGDLVMAGAARLSRAQALVQISTPTHNRLLKRPVTHATFAEATTPGAGGIADIDDPEVVSFTIAKPAPCPLQSLYDRVLNSQYLFVVGARALV